MEKIGFIGTGNMGEALIRGILENGVYKKDQIIVFDKIKEKLSSVSKRFGLKEANSNADLVKNSEVILICVKPQDMYDLLDEIKGCLKESQLLVSIAAGIPTDAIIDKIGKQIPTVRVMPNTPALVQKGISGISYGRNIKEMHKKIVRKIFGAVGEIIEVEEELIDAITAVSGSGPGYVFRIMEYMVEAAMRIGIGEEDAKKLVIQTFLGSAYLAKESGRSISELRKMVTSPKGTTEAGLSVFEKEGLRDIISHAIEEAYKRAKQIKKQAGERL